MGSKLSNFLFTLASFCVATSTAIAAGERINHAGRILGPSPVVTTSTLFNTAQADAIVSAMQIMPVTNPWNEDISRRPLLSNSAAMIAQIKADLAVNRRSLRAFYEMNYALVPNNQPRLPIHFFNYPDESDLDGGSFPNGNYPIPSNLPIETWPRGTGNLTLQQWQEDINGDGGDRHAIMVMPGAGAIWETWLTKRTGSAWEASNGAKFSLNSNALRPAGWTSGDAAGLPMFPAVVRYDECQRGMVEHALRLCVAKTRREYIYPATHYASSIPATSQSYPAMGQRLRLKSSFVIPANWTKEEKAVLLALKKYGAMVADNSGGFISISVCPDNRFAENAFDHLDEVSIDDFEVVQTTGPTEGPRSPGAPTVNAGPDRSLAQPGTVALNATVNDPSHSAALRWKLYSGPANVSFGSPTEKDTTATFSATGVYKLMFSADDGVHAVAYDAIVVSVSRYVAPPGPLRNISSRLRTGTGESVSIGGFIISGTAAKKVIVRAIGPSLTSAGVPGVLADPVLELHGAGGNLIFSNDNWKDTQGQAIRDTGIAPQSDRESAIVITLQPGAYTALVKGKNNTTGVALVEVYDLAETSASTLANISTRGFVGTGGNAMIGGVILSGSQPSRILFRGIGPSLANAGIQQYLRDPQLELFNEQGTGIGSNNNWKTTQRTEIEATGLAPVSNFESAILTDLAPGNYTVIMTGVSGGTGIGLVEAYNLP